MPVTVIIGGQYGSEGKGKVAHCLSRQSEARIVVRTGGPNAGHTVIDSTDTAVVLRQLPTAALIPNVKCFLGPGSYIDAEVLLDEIRRTGLETDRLLIDPSAILITQEDKDKERRSGLREAIGSTQTGTGAAVTKRIERIGTSAHAKHEPRLSRFIKPITPILRAELERGGRVVIEGTQGFGLSPFHSPTYPYVTSRDTTAAAFVSEVGLSVFDVDEVVMVLRAFPIRVPGKSGPLVNEISWSEITAASGSSIPIIEHTSVTKTVRRVARFDPDIVQRAIMVNCPNVIVLNHVDYIDAGCRDGGNLTEKALHFVQEVESLISAQIDYVGVGPSVLLRNSKRNKNLRLA
jgi:adenylosuccinate synthase